jgi:hypothetical protein
VSRVCWPCPVIHVDVLILLLSSVTTVGQLGGVVGSNIYLARESPKYPLGFGLSLSMLFFGGFCVTLVMRALLARENRRRDKISVEEVRAKYTDEELAEMGDKSPLFKVSTTFTFDAVPSASG